jgi:hypothetical protein
VGYDAGVDAAGEEEAVVYVGHHAFFDGGGEGGADFVVGWLGDGGVLPWGIVLLFV